MSEVATYWPYIASIMNGSMMPSVDMVCNVWSSFDSQFR